MVVEPLVVEEVVLVLQLQMVVAPQEEVVVMEDKEYKLELD